MAGFFFRMSKSDKLPAIQFYPGDWRKDPGVQALDYWDRGVWLEMLLIMHGSERRGYLILNGKAMTDQAIARTLGLNLLNQNPTTQDNQNLSRDLTTTLTTLLEYGVASRDEATGAIYSRRMVRDENLRNVRKNAGKMGGNPILVKQNPTSQVKQNLTTGDKQNPTPSVSVSVSVSDEEHTHTPREDDELPGNEEPGHRKTTTQASATEQGQGEAGGIKAICPDVSGGKNALEAIYDANQDLAEIPTEKEWMDACAMGGVPAAFAAEMWMKFDGDRKWWTRRPWRKNIPMVKKWFEEDRDCKGARNHDGTPKTKPQASGSGFANPRHEARKKIAEIDWEKVEHII